MEMGNGVPDTRVGAEKICKHNSTHKETIEHDQLPGQMSLVQSEVEVCDDCGEVVEEDQWI